MKKTMLTLAAAAMALVACQKSPAVQDLTPENSPEQSVAAQAIRFSTNLKNNDIATKAGAGSVDAWNEQDLYILAWDDSKLAAATEVSEEAGFVIPNVKGTAPATGAADKFMTLYHGLQSDETTYEPYYYDEQVDSYSFAGYYVDDAVENPAPTAAEGVITLSEVVIDGAQDILAGTTDKNADRVLSGENEGKQVKIDYVYSAYSARKGVVPDIIFKHMLSKFVFKVQVGGSDAATIAPKLSIQSLTMDAKATGSLQIYPDAAITASVDTTTALALQGLDTPITLSNEYVGAYKALANSLMVIPGEETYTMHLTFKQEGIELAGNQGEVSYDIDLNIADVQWKDGVTATETFAAGKQYNVNIMIYGLEEIKVEVTLSEWEENGDITYDPDDKEGLEDVPEGE